ncbi:hypothetical protein [Pilimelia columellifera]|uniref:Glycosyltransferase n=1 Tax=Pilimelia columellifera subsp. columellifera TaxID=706583 RepID=A0ABP6AN13_9ACTN
MTRHTVLLSFAATPRPPVLRAVHRLREIGDRVTVLALTGAGWEELAAASEIALITADGAELRHPARAPIELVLRRAPRAFLRRASGIGLRHPAIRPVGRVAGRLADLHGRLYGAYNRRIFMPVYGLTVRSTVLATTFERVLREVSLGPVDRIIAADTLAVTCAWRLAARHPTASATTDLTVADQEQ